MELRLNIGFEQILNLIRQLPANQIVKLREELNNKDLIESFKTDISEFQNFLLSGPVMSDKQYNNFLKNREQFNKWRQK